MLDMKQNKLNLRSLLRTCVRELRYEFVTSFNTHKGVIYSRCALGCNNNNMKFFILCFLIRALFGYMLVLVAIFFWFHVVELY